MSNELIPQQYRENFKTATDLEAQAKKLALSIKDDATYREASAFRVTIDKQLKACKVIIKPTVSAAHFAHQEAKKVETTVSDPMENALEILDPQISRWRIEQENARRIEQEKINRQLQKDEEDRRLAEAEELAKSGKKEEAEAILEAPIVAPQVVLPPTTKVDGISDRTYWSADVFDLKLLCKAVAEGKADVSCVMAHMPTLNGIAKGMKAAMNAEWSSKGVRAVSRNDISGGR